MDVHSENDKLAVTGKLVFCDRGKTLGKQRRASYSKEWAQYLKNYLEVKVSSYQAKHLQELKRLEMELHLGHLH